MAEPKDPSSGRAFRVCLNGMTVRECASESDAIGAAIELNRAIPAARVTVTNDRTGLTVDVPVRSFGPVPGPEGP